MNIQGLSHLTLIVHDLEKTTLLFEKIFSAEMLYDSGDHSFSLSRERFFRIGDLWIVAMQGKALPERTYNHIAFQIAEDDFEGYKKRIADFGLALQTPRTRVEGEGRSLYFYDDDNHLFELHTGTLAERLQAYQAYRAVKP